MNYTITTEQAGARLDVFLAERTEHSRSQWQKAIKAGSVTVNEKTVAPHHKLRTDDAVAVHAEPQPQETSVTKPTTRETNVAKELEPRIITENDDYLVIDKPAGLIVHPGEGVHEATLADWLVQRYPAIAEVGDDPLRPGIVHRLDKEASGVMVVAKTAQAFAWLKRQFKNREVEKEYLALVYGATSKDTDTITFPIARSAQGFKMAALPNEEQAKAGATARAAHTTFNVEQRFINYTYLRVGIATGRTHQIRVHMSAYGHPIVGDDLYGTKKTRTLNEKVNLGRIFLHAVRLAFTDLDHQHVTFEAALPQELEQALKTVK